MKSLKLLDDNKISNTKPISYNLKKLKDKVRSVKDKIIKPKNKAFKKDSNKHDKLKNRFKEKEWKTITYKKLPKDFPLEVKKGIIEFEKHSNKFKDGNEWGLVINLTKNKTETIHTDGKPSAVNPLKGEYGDDELIVIHNHNDGSPPSPSDIGKLFKSKENIKYLIVGTLEEYYIIKPRVRNSSNFKELNNKAYELFKKDVLICNTHGTDVFYSTLWNSYNKDEVLNNYMEFFMVIK